MAIEISSCLDEGTNSMETGRRVGDTILDGLEAPPKQVIVYLTDNHDQTAFIEGISAVLGPEVPLLGCSSQGVIGRGTVVEDRYAASVMGLGGDGLIVRSGTVGVIQEDTIEKGRSLGRVLRGSDADPEPKVVVLHYDPLCGVDADLLLKGLHEEIACPIVGGAASHAFFNAPLRETRVYCGNEVMEGSAVAFSLGGEFSAETGICHGCAPVGIEMTVTKSEANRLLELDGRSAVSVWEELCGGTDQDSSHTASLSIGVPVKNPRGEVEGYLMRAAYDMNPKDGVIIATHVPEGTEVMLHHRTVDDVLNGAKAMAEDFRERLKGKRVRAGICFECGARAKPFLGVEDTRKENQMIQRIVGEDAHWIGMLAWGELFPVGQSPTFHNYAFPLLVIAD